MGITWLELHYLLKYEQLTHEAKDEDQSCHHQHQYLIIVQMETQKHSGNDQPVMAFLQMNRYEVEETAVFMDYSRQSLISNLEHFKGLNIYQRTAFAKNISSLREALTDSPEHFYSFLLLLANDCESNQSELIAYLTREHHMHSHDELFGKDIVPVIMALITNAHLDIKEQSCKLLIQIVHLMTIQERGNVVSFAAQLVSRQDEDIKIVALQLMCRFSKYLSHPEVEKYFKNEYLTLYDSSTLRLKKEIVFNCAAIGKNVSQHFLDHDILEVFFAEKCKEPIMGVRKSCAEVLPNLIELTNHNKNMLANLMLTLVKDSHKIVRLTACKAVPEFLARFNTSRVPDALFEFYVGLSEHEVNKIVNRENEILYPISFYFTAILKLVGVNGWSKMSRLFNKLIFIRNEELNLPLASSLHQIASIIGPEHAKEYVFPAINGILKHHSDELKLAVISHFAEFLSIFDSTTRENLIDVFMILQKNPKKFRMRQEIARQLTPIAHVYEPETLFRYIFPIALKLCNDAISCVREEAAYQMCEVIKGMSKDPTYENIAEESLKGFGLSMQYLQRQTFARMVATLHELPDFRQKYFAILLQLAEDPIILVKCSLMISISKILKKHPQKEEIFRSIVGKLRQDEEIRENFD